MGQYVVRFFPGKKAPRGMYLGNLLVGRKERRLRVVVVVNVARLEPVSPERDERTYTDNISAHGARVRSTCAWRLGEETEITPVSGKTPVRGEVVYCERLDNDIFFVGIKIRESRIPWSILQRFDGHFLTGICLPKNPARIAPVSACVATAD